MTLREQKINELKAQIQAYSNTPVGQECNGLYIASEGRKERTLKYAQQCLRNAESMPEKFWPQYAHADLFLHDDFI